jgi:aminoglycoside 6'-N-acetyltransferase I
LVEAVTDGRAPQMKNVDLTPEDQDLIEQVATLLRECFAHIPDWMPTFDDALAEVRETFGPRRISRVAVDDDGRAVGWIGGNEQYEGHVYELHPLAVKPEFQRRGVGTALVRDFEEQVRQRGAMTVILGSDDDFGGTTLYGADVYPDIWQHIAAIRNVANHPYEFYQKCGYAIVGLIPDANGFGKPDILMAKRVGKIEEQQER